MKFHFLLFISLLLTTLLSAQKKQALTPKLSPFQKTEIQIGIVDVTLEYSRPSMRGRKIFGELVSYNEIWRTGANRNTKLIFNERVLIGDQLVEAGTYSLFTKPNAEKWEIYFHTLIDDFGAPDILEEKNIVAQLTIPAVKLDKAVETLAINFENFTSNSAILSISWENFYIPISIKSPTDKILDQELFKANTGLAGKYESAAWTYFEYEKNNEKALATINKCIAQMEKEEPLDVWLKVGNMDNPNRPRRYLLKAQIHEALGQKEKALVAAQQSLTIAQTINDDFYIERISKLITRLKDSK